MTPLQAPPAPGKPKRRRRRWLIVLLILLPVLAILAILVSLLFSRGTTVISPETQIVPVTRGTQTTQVSVDGILQPTRQAQLSFDTAGTVTSVRVNVGDQVSKGEVLARIDDAELADAVDLASANLTSAEAQLTQARDADASSAALTAARAQVNSAAARLSSARLALRNATLRAPLTGIVAAVNIDDGDAVTPGGTSAISQETGAASATGHLVVVSTKSWTVHATVGAADIGSLAKSQSALVRITGTDREIPAKVDTIGIVASSNGATAVFPLTLRVTGSPKDLYSGMSVGAVIITSKVTDVLTVPSAAIIDVDGKPGVMKLVGGSPTETQVEIGRLFGDRTEIVAGLAEGDEIQVTMVGPGFVPEGNEKPAPDVTVSR
ncbi:MAG: efflux RND transporter periplasmic adaptor subunit [Micropruina sp.]